MSITVQVVLLMGIVGVCLFCIISSGNKKNTAEKKANPLAELRKELEADPQNEEAYELLLQEQSDVILAQREGPALETLMQEFMALVQQMKTHVPYSQKPDLIRAKLLYELKAATSQDEKSLMSANALFEKEILAHPYTVAPFIYWANAVGGTSSLAGRTLQEQVQRWNLINTVLENALVYSHASPTFVRSKWIGVYLAVIHNRHSKLPIRMAAAVQAGRQAIYCLDNLEAWLLSHGLTMGQADRELTPVYHAFFTALEEIPLPFALPLLDNYVRVIQKLTFVSETTAAARTLDFILLFRALESTDEPTMLAGLEAFDRLKDQPEDINPHLNDALPCRLLLARGYLFKARFANNEQEKNDCLQTAIPLLLGSSSCLEKLSSHALHVYSLIRIQQRAYKHTHPLDFHLVREKTAQENLQYAQLPSEYLLTRANYVTMLAEQGASGFTREDLYNVAKRCRAEAERRKNLPEFVDRLHPSEASAALIESLLFPENGPFGPLLPRLAPLAEEE